ncbi:MAG: hypothetical protein ACYDBV_12480 [Nitrospiria bacterium]
MVEVSVSFISVKNWWRRLLYYHFGGKEKQKVIDYDKKIYEVNKLAACMIEPEEIRDGVLWLSGREYNGKDVNKIVETFVPKEHNAKTFKEWWSEASPEFENSKIVKKFKAARKRITKKKK